MVTALLNCIKTRGLLLAVALTFFVGNALAQGDYAPVVKTDLVGAKFNHYYGPNDKAVIPPDFSWSFTSTNLVISAGKGPIPADLIAQLAPGVKEVKRIEADWKLEAGRLVISGIKVNGQPTRTIAKLPVGRTAPTVIRIGDRQYVFVPQ